MEGRAVLLLLLLARLLLVLLPSALPLPLLPLYLPAQDALVQALTSTCRGGSPRSGLVRWHWSQIIFLATARLSGREHCCEKGAHVRDVQQRRVAHQQCVRQSLACPCHSFRPC